LYQFFGIVNQKMEKGQEKLKKFQNLNFIFILGKKDHGSGSGLQNPESMIGTDQDPH